MALSIFMTPAMIHMKIINLATLPWRESSLPAGFSAGKSGLISLQYDKKQISLYMKELGQVCRYDHKRYILNVIFLVCILSLIYFASLEAVWSWCILSWSLVGGLGSVLGTTAYLLNRSAGSLYSEPEQENINIMESWRRTGECSEQLCSSLTIQKCGL